MIICVEAFHLLAQISEDPFKSHLWTSSWVTIGSVTNMWQPHLSFNSNATVSLLNHTNVIPSITCRSEHKWHWSLGNRGNLQPHQRHLQQSVILEETFNPINKSRILNRNWKFKFFNRCTWIQATDHFMVYYYTYNAGIKLTDQQWHFGHVQALFCKDTTLNIYE